MRTGSRLSREQIADGGLIEPIPYETALREGATDVLVLRSRPAGYRKPPQRDVAERVVGRLRKPLRALLREQSNLYNRQAEELQSAGPHIAQVAVPDGTPLIRRFESDGARVRDALKLGAEAMAAVLTGEHIQPAHVALRS